MAITIPRFPSVPITLDREVQQYLGSLSERKHGAPGRITDIDAVTIEDRLLLVLGKYDISLSRVLCHTITRHLDTEEEVVTTFDDPDTFITETTIFFTIGLYALAPSVRKRIQQKRTYDQEVARCRAQNFEDAKQKISGIRVYQGSISELERELGWHGERVDTQGAETFLRAEDTFGLRLQAYRLGADAIVHYVPGSSIGTPVRFVDKK